MGGLLSIEKLPVSGSGLRDLSLDRLSIYLKEMLLYETVPTSEEDWWTRLCSLDFMVKRAGGAPVCTVAGLMLFGNSPRRLQHQAGVGWMAFSGAD